MMKRITLTSILLLTITFLIASAAVAQNGVTGKVVDVLDGKTLVMQTSAGRVTIELQYLEVPEQGQPFYSIAKDHLSKLAVGKFVEHKTHRLIRGISIGRTVSFDGVDLSLQMIRDGAAWHQPRNTSEQSAAEGSEYSAIQDLARNEKRGIWSMPGLKTPWEVRAENEKIARAHEAARRLAHPTPVGVGEFHSDTRRPSGRFTPTSTGSTRFRMDNWVNVFAGAGREPRGLLTYSDPNGKYANVYTSAVLMDFASPGGKERLECRAIMSQSTASRARAFLIGFRAIASDYRFSKGRTRLAIVVDGVRMNLGAPFGWRSNSLVGAEEVMYFRLSWSQLKKIGSAKKVEFYIDRLVAPLSEDGRSLFKDLATATG